MFEIPIQAAIGQTDRTRNGSRHAQERAAKARWRHHRKRKLLEKQKKGKQRMKRVGRSRSRRSLPGDAPDGRG